MDTVTGVFMGIGSVVIAILLLLLVICNNEVKSYEHENKKIKQKIIETENEMEHIVNAYANFVALMDEDSDLILQVKKTDFKLNQEFVRLNKAILEYGEKSFSGYDHRHCHTVPYEFCTLAKKSKKLFQNLIQLKR